MWAFLVQEVMFFGGLFTVYLVYRSLYPEAFHAGSAHLPVALGTLNTAILVTSSFFAAWAVNAAQRGRTQVVVRSLLTTLGLGLCFLGVKAVEYGDHFAEGIYPGSYYRFEELPGAGPRAFFTLYFFMTVLHAAHVIGGLTALAVLAYQRTGARAASARFVSLELGVLYWHLVDVIWIFLWPLLYLAG